MERRLTDAPHGHILTNAGVWSPDGQWLVYDVRSDPAGAVFDGTRIERVHVATGQVEVLYASREGACCGVAQCSPVDDRVSFILGPERPTPNFSYGPDRRQGVIVRASRPGQPEPLDARDLVPPFTPGALRGGTHVHAFSGDGEWLSFTYDDHVLANLGRGRRTIAVAAPLGPVVPLRSHPRNHPGSHWCVVVAETEENPSPGSDRMARAYEDAWIGVRGYRRADGGWQRRALAFLGEVRTPKGEAMTELFAVDLPDDVRQPGKQPLAGTADTAPAPPQGCVPRRLTFTAEGRHPGLGGPRFWPRSSPDGERIAVLRRDGQGIPRLWTVSPRGGPPFPVGDGGSAVESAFTWSPDGHWLAHVQAGAICVTHADTGEVRLLTEPRAANAAPRPEACVFSPDGRWIAYVRPAASRHGVWNQVCVCAAPEPTFPTA